MSFNSLIKPLDLKQIIHSLNSLHSYQQLPFYVIKIRNETRPMPSTCSLSLTRKISPNVFNLNLPYYSIWSMYHLETIQNLNQQQIQEKIILKNPYKSSELIQQCFKLGIRNLMVQTYEEMEKIQKIRFAKNMPAMSSPKFIWSVSEDNDLSELQSLARNKINIDGLNFNSVGEPFNCNKIQTIAKRVKAMGHKLEKIISTIQYENSMEARQEWQKKSEGPIKRILDITNYSDIHDYLLVTKIHGRSKGRIIMNEESLQCTKDVDQSKNSTTIKVNENQWLVSSLSKFPLNQNSILSFDDEEEDFHDSMGHQTA